MSRGSTDIGSKKRLQDQHLLLNMLPKRIMEALGNIRAQLAPLLSRSKLSKLCSELGAMDDLYPVLLWDDKS